MLRSRFRDEPILGKPNSPLHLSVLLGSAPAGPGLALRSPQVNAMVLGLAFGDSCFGGARCFGVARCLGDEGTRFEVMKKDVS